jgi:peptidoglycan/xylan/chitin deacetylase (PgdA/CDA1 family)
MFEQGLSVILYDAPKQVASLNKHSQYSLYGMQFRRFTDNSYSKLALVGDQELSLGFDAGSIIDVNRLSRHYTVHSLYPQAVAIDSANRSGGTLLTRLYAQTVAKGRFVWMDFSPNTGDHAHDLAQEKFEGVVASIFRYLSKKPYQAVAMWPEGKRFAALLEEDTEDKFHYADRVHRFFIENNYPITWYILSNEAQINRALTRDLAVSGEVACHGDNHRPFTLSDMQEQHKRIARCQKVLLELTGKKVASFRPPEEKFVDETLDAMTNNDITHFIAQYGVDRFVPIIMTSTVTGKQLVSLPRMATDDFELWHRLKMKTQVSKKLTLQEINYVEALSGLYIFSFHTQFMGDDDNFSVVKDIAHHINKKDAYFQTTSMISEWWKVRTRLIAGKAIKEEEIQLFKPVLLRVNTDGKLVSSAYTNLHTAKK